MPTIKSTIPVARMVRQSTDFVGFFFGFFTLRHLLPSGIIIPRNSVNVNTFPQRKWKDLPPGAQSARAFFTRGGRKMKLIKKNLADIDFVRKELGASHGKA